MLDIQITKTTSPKAKPADESKLGFGKIFTDHMFVMDYTAGQGLARRPHRPLSALRPGSRLRDVPLRPGDL